MCCVLLTEYAPEIGRKGMTDSANTLRHLPAADGSAGAVEDAAIASNQQVAQALSRSRVSVSERFDEA